MRFDIIFFDSGGTLFDTKIQEEPTWKTVRDQGVVRLHHLLMGFGFDVAMTELEGVLRRVGQALPAKLGAAYNFQPLMVELLAEFGHPDEPEIAACLASAYCGPRYRHWLFPDVVDSLAALAERGQRMGIIANTAWPGYTMERAFTGVGILKYFDVRVYSGDVGVEKPDAGIFELAAKQAGVSGNNILYVGNDVEKDVIGARDIGWKTAFRVYDQSTDGLADFEFTDMATLVTWIGE